MPAIHDQTGQTSLRQSSRNVCGGKNLGLTDRRNVRGGKSFKPRSFRQSD
jgi:hypothetical protein